jgi:hypothetical protein
MKKIILFLITAVSMSCKRDVNTVVLPPAHKIDTVTLAASASTLSFGGYTWNIKDSGTGTVGPGPNRWSRSNAYLDANGYLHLKITNVAGKWYCAEITSAKSFGYGTYQWYVEGRIDTLDKNVVLGLFNYSGADGFDEMDIEYARWGIATANNTNFTVYPAQGSALANWHTTRKTTLTGGDYTTQRFKRKRDTTVYFQELAGFQTGNTNQIVAATCTNPPNSISKLAMPVHMNLWLFQGHAPANKSQVELIIHNFKFTPQ